MAIITRPKNRLPAQKTKITVPPNRLPAPAPKQSALNKIVNTIKSTFSSGGTSAASINALDYDNPVNNKLQEKNRVNHKPYKDNSAIPYAVIETPTSYKAGTKVSNNTNQNQPYATIQTPTSFSSGTKVNNVAPTYSPPVETSFKTTVDGDQLGAQSFSSSGGTSSIGSFAGIGGSAGGGVASNYTGTAIGNNIGLGAGSDGIFKVEDPSESMFDVEEQKEKSAKDYIQEAIGLFDDAPKVNEAKIRERAEREAGLYEAKQRVANTQNQINTITAKLNQDLLQLRQTGSEEGVTEAVYGGQQATLSREATIKLLPLQAQLATDQGNLELAQEHSDNLFKMRFEEATDRADRWMKAAEMGYDNYTKAEQKKLDKIKETYDRRKSEVSDLNNYVQSIADDARKSGNMNVWRALSSMTMPDPTATNYDAQLANAKKILGNFGAQITPGSGSSITPTQVNDGAVRAGLDIQEFKSLPTDVQVFFSQTNDTAIQPIKDELRKIVDGESTAEKFNKWIDSQSVSATVKNFLKSQAKEAEASAPAKEPGFWSKIWNSIF